MRWEGGDVADDDRRIEVKGRERLLSAKGAGKWWVEGVFEP